MVYLRKKASKVVLSPSLSLSLSHRFSTIYVLNLRASSSRRNFLCEPFRVFPTNEYLSHPTYNGSFQTCVIPYMCMYKYVRVCARAPVCSDVHFRGVSWLSTNMKQQSVVSRGNEKKKKGSEFSVLETSSVRNILPTIKINEIIKRQIILFELTKCLTRNIVT